MSPAQKDNKAYWTPIFEALGADGPAHLLYYLLNYPYDRDVLFRPPMTSAKAEQTLRSMSTVDRWWYEVLCGDRALADEIFGAAAPKAGIYNDYRDWCEDNKKRPEIKQVFWKALRSLVGADLKEKKARRGKERTREVLMPSRRDCQKAFAKAIRCSWEELEAL